MKFHAIEVSTDYNEFDTLVIFLGNEDNYFMIQHSNDEDEAELGAYHIERDGQGYAGYDGVKKWTLHAKSLFIELDEIGQENLDLETLEITFDIDENALGLLKEKLKVALD